MKEDRLIECSPTRDNPASFWSKGYLIIICSPFYDCLVCQNGSCDKVLMIMPSDIRILFQYFYSKNLSAAVLSKMFFFYSLFLLVEY